MDTASVLTTEGKALDRQVEQTGQCEPAGLVLSPSEKLMSAFLEGAIYCFQLKFHARSSRGRRNFRCAEDWILNKEKDGPLSFEHICAVLGLDPDGLRRDLWRWRERQNGHMNGHAATEGNGRHRPNGPSGTDRPVRGRSAAA